MPSPHTVSPASQSGLGTARLFRDHPGHEHSRQCSGRTAHLPVLPCIPLGSACALPLAPASCGCFPLSCTGRSVTSPRPFTCVPGRAVAPLRCTHRRKLVLSPKRTLPEEGHTVSLSPLCFLPVLFLYPAVVRLSPVVCVGVSTGPLGRPLAGSLRWLLPPPHWSAGCFHAVRICRRLWWPRSYLLVNGPFLSEFL